MNWISLMALNEIYLNGQTHNRISILSDSQIAHLVNVTKELRADDKYIFQGRGFVSYYERYHAENFLSYKSFLERNGLLKPQTKFLEEDIRVLIDMEEKMSNGDLFSLREQIIKSHETVRGVSLMFFRNEKHLLSRPSLVDAVKKILNVSVLANEKDQQYKYVLECHNPRLIVLCENIDFLKRPVIPRENNIELWYAGGKNIDKLNYTDRRGLPIYYSCDWDFDGLKIYEAVKNKIPEIELLHPSGAPRNIVTSEHDSLWHLSDQPQEISGLNKSMYSSSEHLLIQSLIINNCWIIEESNDLLSMLKSIPSNNTIL